MKVTFILATSLILASGCKLEDTKESESKKLITKETSAQNVEKALQSKTAFRVNLTTNKTTFYKDGKAVAQWNVATGDIGSPENKDTPTGIFTVDDFTYCPSWRPSKVVDPATGEKTSDYAVRKNAFESNPDLYGACGKYNPLGKYLISFTGPYYLHGNSNESILERKDPESRRVSGGCVRNPNAIIQKYFHLVLNEYDSLKSFSSSVKSAENMGSKKTLTKYISGEDIRVVVGWLGSDPVVGAEIEAGGEDEASELPAVSASDLKKLSISSVLGKSSKVAAKVPVDLNASTVIADTGKTLDKLKTASIQIESHHMDGAVKPLGNYDVPLDVESESKGSFKLPAELVSKIENLSTGKVYLRMTAVQVTGDGTSANTVTHLTGADNKKYYSFYIDPATSSLFLK